jgi:hypothetical protein
MKRTPKSIRGRARALKIVLRTRARRFTLAGSFFTTNGHEGADALFMCLLNTCERHLPFTKKTKTIL